MFPAHIDLTEKLNIDYRRIFSERVPIFGITSPEINLLFDTNVLSYQKLDKVLQNIQGLDDAVKLKFALDITMIIREFEEAKIPLCLHPKNFSVSKLVDLIQRLHL